MAPMKAIYLKLPTVVPQDVRLDECNLLRGQIMARLQPIHGDPSNVVQELRDYDRQICELMTRFPLEELRNLVFQRAVRALYLDKHYKYGKVDPNRFTGNFDFEHGGYYVPPPADVAPPPAAVAAQPVRLQLQMASTPVFITVLTKQFDEVAIEEKEEQVDVAEAADAADVADVVSYGSDYVEYVCDNCGEVLEMEQADGCDNWEKCGMECLCIYSCCVHYLEDGISFCLPCAEEEGIGEDGVKKEAE